MAVTLKDISIGLQKYAQRQQQQTAKESYTKSELFEMLGMESVPPDLITKPTGAPTLSADVVAEKSIKINEEQTKEIKEVSESVTDDSADGLLAEQKEQTKQLEDLNKFQKEQLDALLKLGKSFETFKTPMEKLSDKLKVFSSENFKETILEKINIKLPLIGGIFDKAIAREKFIKQERMLGSTKSTSELTKDFKSYNEQSKIIQKNSATISKIKAALPDASDEQLMRVPEYARAKQESEAAAKESGKFTIKSSIMHPTNEDVGSTTKKQPKKRTPQLASSTVPDNIKPAPIRRAQEPTTVGGGLFDKVQKIGTGMIGLAKGVAAMGGALIVLTLGLKSISEISFESIAKATVAIGGLVVVSKLLGGTSGSMLKGALGLAALGAALLVAGEGFKSFAELDWEVLAKAGVAIGGLALAAAGIGAIVGPILLGAAAIAAIGGSVWLLAKGVDALANAMDRITSPRAANKPAVGAPTEQPTTTAATTAPTEQPTTTAAGAAAPAPTSARTPAEETKPISGNIQAKQTGPGQYEAVSSGITSDDIVNHPNYKTYYEQALGGRTGPDAERMAKRTARMKVERDLIKQSAAGVTPTTGVQETTAGVTPTTGAVEASKPTIATKVTPAPVASANLVYGASAENASAAAVVGGGTTNNVVAPTTVNNTTNQMGGYKPDVRNQDSSFKRMLDARYVPV